MSSQPQLTPDQLNYAETAQWKTILKQALADLRVSIPAIVQAFDAMEGTVDVQVAIREIVRTPNGPANTAINPIFKVPVCFPSGGGFSLTLPIQPGDEGMLVFCDMCIDLWWMRGGLQNQFERRRHDLVRLRILSWRAQQAARAVRIFDRFRPSFAAMTAQRISKLRRAECVNIVAPWGPQGERRDCGDRRSYRKWNRSASTHVHGGVQRAARIRDHHYDTSASASIVYLRLDADNDPIFDPGAELSDLEAVAQAIKTRLLALSRRMVGKLE